MKYYVGLDVSLNTVFVCIVNEKGKVIKEYELPSTPEAIGSFLIGTDLEIAKIGLFGYTTDNSRGFFLYLL